MKAIYGIFVGIILFSAQSRAGSEFAPFYGSYEITASSNPDLFSKDCTFEVGDPGSPYTLANDKDGNLLEYIEASPTCATWGYVPVMTPPDGHPP